MSGTSIVHGSSSSSHWSATVPGALDAAHRRRSAHPQAPKQAPIPKLAREDLDSRITFREIVKFQLLKPHRARRSGEDF
jgi:hypothetical protein